MPVHAPPPYAWDWLARQRLPWREIRRRLLASERMDRNLTVASSRVSDVPDWSSDHPDLRLTAAAVPPAAAPAGNDGRTRRDYRPLDTRAEVIAALRLDYPDDREVQAIVDAVIAQLAFLGRLDVPLHELGVRSAPRGMRWWWCHLGGTVLDEGRSGPDVSHEHGPTLPTQLRLVDVLAGYGDIPDA